jgi:hypothetical protein
MAMAMAMATLLRCTAAERNMKLLTRFDTMKTITSVSLNRLLTRLGR